VSRRKRYHTFLKSGGKGLRRQYGRNLVGGRFTDLQADLIVIAANLNKVHSFSSHRILRGPADGGGFLTDFLHFITEINTRG
jgi:hypothetical protein